MRTVSTTLILAVVCAALSAGEARLPTFTDVTEDIGLRFKHGYGDHDLSNIVEATGPGCMFFDFDGDGRLDIYLVNGCWRRDVNDNRGRRLKGKLANKLFRNQGDGRFTDVTDKAGVGDQGYGMGCSAADYDRDGDLDLYVLNYGPNVLYRNNGDGTFTDVSAKSRLDDPLWSLSAPWLDYDNDGDLDVYVANYLEYDQGRFRDFYAAAGFPGPLSYRGQPDRLYRNNGDGTFSDVTKAAGVHNPDGRAMSAVATDVDSDGFLDIYVANDATPNFFYLNRKDGTFKEAAMTWGLAFGEGGQGASSMGPVVGDVDRDGRLDFYVPDMGYGCLLLGQGKFFVDATAQTGLALICGQYTGWGGGLFDYDNDGYLDLFVANGNAHHEYTEEDVLARYDGKGRFVDVASASGPYFREKLVGRGAAFGDYDNDGDLDILVANLNGPARLLRNDGGNRNHWLTIVPRLSKGRPEAIGTRVTVTVGSLRLVQEALGAMGYLSQSDPRPHFGLGEQTKADRVEVRWPDRRVQTLENVKANQILEVIRTAE